TYRLFNLTYVQHARLVESAKSQYNNPAALLAGRGNIYFSDFSPGGKKIAAANKSSFFLYSNNNAVFSKEAAEKIAPILNQETGVLELLLNQKDKSYLVIARDLSREQADKIKILKLSGLTVASGIDRFYANGTLASTVLGFVGFDGNRRVGQYGVESSYDNVLSGETRTQNLWGNKTYSDVFKSLKFWSREDDELENAESQNEDGSDVVLTINADIQSMVEIKLDALLKKWDARSGSIIVEDPATGAILAMASSPSFNPNSYAEYKLEDFINPNVQEVFEPGSSFKPVTMSGAIDSGAVTPDTTYNDTGEKRVGGYTIRNFNEKANGIQTMRQVLQHSLNTGAIFAQEKTGDDTFLNYVVNFGFGQKTGVDLKGEVFGNISNLYSGRKINFLTASFGQGIAVTPLQLINAYAAIANGGKLMRPYLVKNIIRSDGSVIKTEPVILGAPITEKTSVKLKTMLVDVVEKGFDKARIAGYDVAGKTGTAQIPDPRGGYLDNDQFIHDFVGFAPAYSPKFVVLIKMDRPKGIKFAADSLSPVFGDIARNLIRYFNIPPTRN
ncbi:MAG: penicillin-binding protein 2, partial [Parcubacteria group bacterium]|nr:penicillin-binding protein 2 [Parcubacteria group bacterium]